jgi:hypothetical protein
MIDAKLSEVPKVGAIGRWRYRLKFWWDFSTLKFYLCLVIHRRYRWLPGNVLESACEKCFDQSKWRKGIDYR